MLLIRKYGRVDAFDGIFCCNALFFGAAHLKLRRDIAGGAFEVIRQYPAISRGGRASLKTSVCLDQAPPLVARCFHNTQDAHVYKYNIYKLQIVSIMQDDPVQRTVRPFLNAQSEASMSTTHRAAHNIRGQYPAPCDCIWSLKLDPEESEEEFTSRFQRSLSKDERWTSRENLKAVSQILAAGVPHPCPLECLLTSRSVASDFKNVFWPVIQLLRRAQIVDLKVGRISMTKQIDAEATWLFRYKRSNSIYNLPDIVLYFREQGDGIDFVGDLPADNFLRRIINDFYDFPSPAFFPGEKRWYRLSPNTCSVYYRRHTLDNSSKMGYLTVFQNPHVYQ